MILTNLLVFVMSVVAAYTAVDHNVPQIVMTFYVYFIVSIMILNSFFSDEKTNWHKYCDTLPISRKTTASFPFLNLLVTDLAVFVTVCVFHAIFSAVRHKPSIFPDIGMMIMCCAVCMAIASLCLFIAIVINYRAAVVAYAAVCFSFGIYMGYVGAAEDGSFADAEEFLRSIFTAESPAYPVLLVMSAVVFAASWAVSVKVYGKKEC